MSSYDTLTMLCVYQHIAFWGQRCWVLSGGYVYFVRGVCNSWLICCFVAQTITYCVLTIVACETYLGGGPVASEQCDVWERTTSNQHFLISCLKLYNSLTSENNSIYDEQLVEDPRPPWVQWGICCLYFLRQRINCHQQAPLFVSQPLHRETALTWSWIATGRGKREEFRVWVVPF